MSPQCQGLLILVADQDDYEKISSGESDFEADEGEKQQQQSEFPYILYRIPFTLLPCVSFTGMSIWSHVPLVLHVSELI